MAPAARGSGRARKGGGAGSSSYGRRTGGDKEPNPHAVALGRLGGLKGGKARAEKLSKQQRSAIARRAANARWSAQRGD